MKTIINILKYIYRRPQHILIQILSRIYSKPLDISQLDNVLIIAPHPDDEVLGCTGLMDILVKSRKSVSVLFLSEGEGIAKHSNYAKEEIIEIRRKLALKALSSLGINEDKVQFLSFPDGNFKAVSDNEINKLQSIIQSGNFKTIFYPHHWDGSPDHNFASEVVVDILKHTHDVNSYEYCVWLWHHMKMYKAFSLDYKNVYLLNIDTEIKANAISIYTDAHDDEGFYYSGKLPLMFLKALRWSKELYFKSNI